MFLFDLTITGLIVGSFYALVGLGFTVFYGTLRLINFAHGDTYMIGAFIGFAVLSALGTGAGSVTGVTAAVVGTILATGVLGLAMQVIYAKVHAAGSHFGPLIAAIGVSIALENAALHIWGSEPQVYPVVMPSGNVKIVITLLITFGIMLGTELWVARTRFGTAMRAVGMDHDAVRLMGIRINRVITITFFVFSAIAGITGLIAGFYYSSIDFLMGFILGIKGFTAAVLGGVGNIRGALVGGLVLGLLESYGAGYLGGQWSDVIAFVVLIAVLALRPTGLLGETVVERM